jgi:hypothetical protein
MTIIEIARQTESDYLRRRIAEAAADHAAAVARWEADAEPIRRRLEDNDAKYRATMLVHYRKAREVARLDLDNLPARPVEPLSLGMLQGRLALIESRS